MDNEEAQMHEEDKDLEEEETQKQSQKQNLTPKVFQPLQNITSISPTFRNKNDDEKSKKIFGVQDSIS